MFVDLQIYSTELTMLTEVKVIIPDWVAFKEDGTRADEKMKCLYLLHGLGDNQTAWARRTSIERYAGKYGFCVVMPTGAKSFYSDEQNGFKYYSYVAKELPRIIEGLFNVSGEAKDRYIGGNSMGGYGALKIALREKGRYAAAFGLSSVADIHNATFTANTDRIFGGEIPDDADLYKLVEEHEKDEVKPRLYMTIGKGDYMYEDNLKFQAFMQGKKYDYTFVETDGDHTWDLWDATVQDALKWIYYADCEKK